MAIFHLTFHIRLLKTKNQSSSQQVVADSTTDSSSKDFESEENLERIDYASLNSGPASPEFAKRLLFNLSESEEDFQFLLFSNPRRVNSSKPLVYGDVESVMRSGFVAERNTVLLIHGFWSDGSDGMAFSLRRAYLQARVPLNIVVVDWGKLSTPDPKSSANLPLAYPIVVTRNIPIVYNRVADFIQFLAENNLTSLEKVWIVGHSLGAHVGGGAGDVLQAKYEGRKVSRVTGLDPASPLFEGLRLQRRLNKTDAEFVDVYHTAAGTLGTVLRTQGHADFFRKELF